MSDTVIRDVIRYIEYLKNTYNLFLTVHDTSGFLPRYNKEFIPCNMHYNPYCLFIKSNKQLWDKCVNRQYKVYNACESGMFFGMCYAGVEEYVLPIKNRNGYLGFVSVSGYRTDTHTAMKKIDHLSNNYVINKNKLIEEYYRNLNNVLPEKDWIETIVSPICRLIEYFYMKEHPIYIEKWGKAGTEYIYGHMLLYIEYNYGSKIQMEELSKVCNCSVSYASKIFRKKSGLTINAYINNIRIEKAKQFLLNTNLNIQEISQLTGFADGNYFSNTFKKICGISPREFRKTSLSEN